jgi:hypothetical protein
MADVISGEVRGNAVAEYDLVPLSAAQWISAHGIHADDVRAAHTRAAFLSFCGRRV